MNKKETFREWEELMSDDKDRKSAPCKFGMIVEKLACYCHADTEDAPLKCPIWNKHGKNKNFWKKGMFDEDACPFFEEDV